MVERLNNKIFMLEMNDHMTNRDYEREHHYQHMVDVLGKPNHPEFQKILDEAIKEVGQE